MRVRRTDEDGGLFFRKPQVFAEGPSPGDQALRIARPCRNRPRPLNTPDAVHAPRLGEANPQHAAPMRQVVNDDEMLGAQIVADDHVALPPDVPVAEFRPPEME
jgi:hypothetical protein